MKKNKVFYGWWIVIASAIVLAITGPAAVAVANIFQGPVTSEFGVSNGQFAISNLLILIISVIFSPSMSQKMASGHFKQSFCMGLICYILGLAGYAFAPNIWVFYALSILAGFGYLATTMIPVGLLINHWFVKDRGLATSYAMSGLGIGGIIFSQLVTFLIGNFGWRMTYLAYAIIMLIIVLPIGLFIFKPYPEEMGLQAYGANLGDNQTGKVSDTATESGLDFDQVKTNAFFIALLVASVLIGIVNNGGLGQFPPFFTELHGPSTAATLISLYSGIGIIGKLILGKVNDKTGIVVSTIYAAGLLVATYLLMTQASHLPLAYIAAITFGLGNAIGTIMPPLISADIFRAGSYAKAYGMVQSATMLGMAVGSLVTATIADLANSYQVSWLVLAIASGLAAFMIITSYRQAKTKY